MKTFYKGLRCPNCASEKFVLTTDDVFQCEACEKKFDIDLDGLEIDYADKAAIDELKSVFHGQIMDLEQKKAENKKFLQDYSVKETQRKLECTAFIVLLFSIGVFLGAFGSPWYILLLMLGLSAGGIGFFVWAKKYRKKMYEQYHPLVVYYAHTIAQCDEQILKYTRLLSKLTP